MHTKCMFHIWFNAVHILFLLLYISTYFYIFFFCLLHVSCLLFCILVHVTFQEFRQVLSLSVLRKEMPVLLLSAALPWLLLLHHVLAIASAVMMLPHQC